MSIELKFFSFREKSDRNKICISALTFLEEMRATNATEPSLSPFRRVINMDIVWRINAYVIALNGDPNSTPSFAHIAVAGCKNFGK